MPGPPQHRDGDHGVDQVRRENGRDRERHHQRRHRQHDVGEPHDPRLDDPAEVAREQSEQDAGRYGDAQDAHDHQQRDAIAEQDAREDVSADVVGAQQVLEAGRIVAMAEVDEGAGMVGVGCDVWCQDRRQHDREDDEDADDRRGIAQEAAPGPREVRQFADRREGAGFDGHRLSSARSAGADR